MKKLISITFIKIINILIIALSVTNTASADGCSAISLATENQSQTTVYNRPENLYYPPSASQYNSMQDVTPQYRSAPSAISAGVNNTSTTNFIQQGNTAYFYVVEKGDSLYTVTRKTNTSLKDLIHINRIPIPYTIYPGQRLYIP